MDLHHPHGLDPLHPLDPHSLPPQDQLPLHHDPLHQHHQQQHRHTHPSLFHIPLPQHLQSSIPPSSVPPSHSYSHHPSHHSIHDSYTAYSPYDIDSLESHVSLPHPHPRAHPPPTCVSTFPPGMDPAQVDMRTFYPYQPNEVKHRKRTTRGQLKVLEDVYKHDTKPNASLRKKLAEELGMTPRGVQVWFQNRRAKTKSQAKKADAAKRVSEDTVAASNPDATGDTNDNLSGSRPSSPASASSPLPGAVMSTPLETVTTPTHSLSDDDTAQPPSAPLVPVASPDSPDDSNSVSSGSHTVTEVPPSSTSQTTPPTLSPARNKPETVAPDLSVGIDTSIFGNPFPFGPPLSDSSADSSPAVPSTPDNHSFGFGIGALNVPDHLRNQRRPSLPIIISPPTSSGHSLRPHTFGHPIPPHQGRPSSLSFPQHNSHSRGENNGGAPFDPTTRRGSVDTNASRLGYHPYAHLVVNANGSTDISHLRRGSMPPALDSHGLAGPFLNPHNGFARRQVTFQRTSMPSFMHPTEEHPTHEESPPRISHAFAGTHAPTGLSGRQGMYIISSKELPPPIPGPLPSPGFSFGDAPTSASPEALSPHSGGTQSSPSITSPLSASSVGPLAGMHFRTRRSTSGPVDDPDTEDDASAVSSNYPGSRFGSFASVAGSESSFTSGGGWSEVSSGVKGQAGGGNIQCGSDGQLHVENTPAVGFERRPSLSGQMLELFSDLDVNGNHTPQPHSQSLSRSQSNDAGHDSPNPDLHEGVSGRAHGQSELTFALRQPENTTGSDNATTVHFPVDYSVAAPDQIKNDPHVHSREGQYTSYPSREQHQHNLGKPGFPGPYDLAPTDSYPQPQAAFVAQTTQNALHFDYMGVGGGGPVYDAGAIELSNMCVPATMDYPLVGPYLQYS